MSLYDPPTVRADMTQKQLANLVAELIYDMAFIINGNIDTRNVRELHAEKIVAGSITADKIAANSITADKMDVNELSAISANLGTITAGSITSDAFINVGTDANIGRLLNLIANSSSGRKGIRFYDSDLSRLAASIDVTSGDLELASTGGYITINAPGGVFVGGSEVAPRGMSVGVYLMGADGNPVFLRFNRGSLNDIS